MEVAGLQIKVSTQEAEAATKRLQGELAKTADVAAQAGADATKGLSGVEKAAAAAESGVAKIAGSFEKSSQGIARASSTTSSQVSAVAVAFEEVAGASQRVAETTEETADEQEKLEKQFHETGEAGRKGGKRAEDGINGVARASAFASGMVGKLVGILTALTGVTVSIAGMFYIARKAYQGWQEQVRVTAQLEAVLKSTQGAAGLTLVELQKMSAEQQNLTGIANESVEAAQRVILTYTTIGRETFPRAMQAAIDMSVAMGMDLKAAAETTARSIGEPIHAMGALAKQGFRFTSEQQNLIKHFTETGQIAQAQAIILDELELAYGGAAAAAGGTMAGAMSLLRENWNAVVKEFGKGMFAAESLEDGIRKLARTLGDPELQAGAVRLGQTIRDAFLLGAVTAVATYRDIMNAADEAYTFVKSMELTFQTAVLKTWTIVRTAWQTGLAFIGGLFSDFTGTVMAAWIEMRTGFDLFADHFRNTFESMLRIAILGTATMVNAAGKALEKMPGGRAVGRGMRMGAAAAASMAPEDDGSHADAILAKRATDLEELFRTMEGARETFSQVLSDGLKEFKEMDERSRAMQVQMAEDSLKRREGRDRAVRTVERIALGDPDAAQEKAERPKINLEPVEFAVQMEDASAMSLMAEMHKLKKEADQILSGEIVIIQDSAVVNSRMRLQEMVTDAEKMAGEFEEAFNGVDVQSMVQKALDSFPTGGGFVPAEVLTRTAEQMDELQRIISTAGQTVAADLQVQLDGGLITEAQFDYSMRQFGDLMTGAKQTGQTVAAALTIRDSNGLITEETLAAYQAKLAEMEGRAQEVGLRMKANLTRPQESFVFGFDQVVQSWGSASERIGVIGAGLAQSLDQNITDGLMGMIDGTMSVQEAFAKMSQAIVQDLIRIMIQQLIVRSVMSAFGGGVGAMHSGGVVGMGMGSRQVDPEAFTGANRYAGGGVAGDEVPIIAHRGEVIFNEEQFGAMMQGMSGGREQKVEVINVTDPSMIDERIASNPNAVLNVISRNRQQVKAALGLR